MSADGSTGRRDGFQRLVAAMKQDHQPVSAKPGALKTAVPKLELELDENATHVHRIPKELISRMRQREAEAEVAEPSSATFESLAGVSDDRTAVFRPPPELLARAKRMKPPAKPSVNEAPTKPPPPLEGDDAAAGVPAAAKVPFVASTPPMTRPSSAPPVLEAWSAAPLAKMAMAPVSRPVPAPPRANAPAPVVPVVVSAAEASPAEEPERDSQVAREIEAGWDDPVPASASPYAERQSAPGSLFDTDEAESGVMPLGGSADPLLAPPLWETTGDLPAESIPPTTSAPVVRSERSVNPQTGSPWVRNVVLFVLGLVAIAALALWKARH
jgi:hypothetical protein